MTRIIVIEDEVPLLEEILDVLGFEGFEATGFDNGITGLEGINKNLPDLIICDIMMPGLDGYGVLIELQKRPETATIPFLFLTARAEKEAMRKGMALGADDYLTKPFTNEELLEAVQARLKKHETLNQHHQDEMQEFRRNISYTLPHELRTPLTGIMGYAYYLADSVDDMPGEQIRSIAEGICRSGIRLQRLIENTLLYAQLEFMKPSPDQIEKIRQYQATNPVYPAEAIEKLAQEKAQSSKRKDDLHLAIEGIEVRFPGNDFKKIAEELIDNAFKFSQKGNGIKISLKKQGTESVFCVEDSGRGMTAEQIEKVGGYMQFDRKIYEQQGSGLGLTIARRLAELYGAKLKIKSAAGEYTHVCVSVP